MTELELIALKWAIQRLTPCYTDSLKALEYGVLVEQASKNADNYEELVSLWCKYKPRSELFQK